MLVALNDYAGIESYGWVLHESGPAWAPGFRWIKYTTNCPFTYQIGALVQQLESALDVAMFASEIDYLK